MKSHSEIEQLHATYCRLTGFKISLAYDRERDWFQFGKVGFTQDDLKLVLAYLKRGIWMKKRNPGCLKFDNLIRQLDWFEMELAEAKAYYRNNRPRTAREEVVESLRPTVCESVLSVNCRPAKVVIGKLIEQMRSEVEK